MSYTIYFLPESQMTISGGGKLDGMTQGDGSHLIGRTLTLNSTNWQGVALNDNDAAFEDNDSGQTLAAPTTIDGVTYAAGKVVEAEYTITVSDGTTTWQMVGFNVNDSSPAYATVEGLAFLGPPGSWPPVDKPLTVVSSADYPKYDASTYVSPVCFAAGTRIAVPGGERPVEEIAVGDLVMTLDGGARPVRWRGGRRWTGQGAFAPVRIAAATLGNRRDLYVSRQHRLYLTGWRAELFFGLPGVLVPAVRLVDGDRIALAPCDSVEYHHLLLDDHHLLLAEGTPAESLYLGDRARGSLSDEARAEIDAIFPELAGRGAPPLARPQVGGAAARLLVPAD
ncbi:Hint domain-containing protein [Wenxinia marina]|uniref:Hint domain protein n=1 Tax=Wenxinia marina DSM 24838 TaxID=1123501 RepID=A0A0D0PFS1_9RHOB|nr:Hint domain-containing protein [Wenxinia marina]KIQ70181.1 Hint domain protein [Wenxinia marina DSM 24838]GGL50765.1 hypothetical protein GCM10011392_01170 [Wenxinia marina]